MERSNSWRSLVALLANPETRRVVARILLGDDLESAISEVPEAKHSKLRKAVIQSGLLGDDSLTLDPNVFRLILASSPVVRREGINKFVEGKRILQYPANLTERGELLAWIARDVFETGEYLSEAELNTRLQHYTEDVVVLRRYLVDFQLVERNPDGTGYAPAVGLSTLAG